MARAERIDAYAASPDAIRTLWAVEKYIKNCGLEQSLIELVKMRASQINGCAFCLVMHSTDARKNGESEKRLYLLDAWREATVFSERERAALAWTDALTKIAETHAPDDVYEQAKAQFNEKELADLTVIIGIINLWNRLSIGLRYLHD